MKWGKVVQWVLGIVVFFGVPLFLSSDSFLTWMYEKSYTSNWSNAATVHLNVAGFFRYTYRLERSGEVNELFCSRYPQDIRYPDAVYDAAVAFRDIGADLEMQAKGDPDLIQKRIDVRKKAMEWYDFLAQKHPQHPKADIARRAAQAIRDGY